MYEWVSFGSVRFIGSYAILAEFRFFCDLF